MRYLVKAKLKQDKRRDLLRAIDQKELGRGSVAEGEYLHDMAQARQLEDNTVCWVETCFCPTPLEEERPYWEEYFELLRIKNAHNPRRCQDLNGSHPWACCDCDCTKHLEAKMQDWGQQFLPVLRTAPLRESAAGE
jgi:hypothetical protein